MLSLQPNANSNSHFWRDCLFLTIILSLFYFALLGTRPLFVPDEGRYAEIAREMVASSDYITPHLNSIKYFEKPAFFYWLTAGMIKLFGVHIWAVRSVNALLSILGCLIIYATGRKLYNRQTGLLAAGILSTSTLYFVMGHTVSLDLPVSVFITSTLCAFLLATQTTPSLERRALMYSSAIAAALAVLTKGLIGILLPGLIIFTWILFTNQWRLLTRLYLPTSILLFLIIATPWHILVGLRNPEFFYFYIIQQHFLRYTTLNIGHYQPVWYFIPIFILSFFPWIVFLPQTIKQTLAKQNVTPSAYQANLFLLFSAILIFLFFSFSKSKLIPYILPVIPPLALLTAHTLQTLFSKSEFKSLIISCGVLCGFAGLVAILYFSLPYKADLPDPKLASIALSLAAVILLMGSLYTFNLFRKQSTHAFTGLFITTALFLLCSLAALPALDKRTVRPLANTLTSIMHPGDEVITYNQYYQDLPFYLQQRISILNWKNELSFGMHHQDTTAWMINNQTFWKRWQSDKRLFVLIDADDYEYFKTKYPHKLHYLIDQTLTRVLISNLPHPSTPQ